MHKASQLAAYGHGQVKVPMLTPSTDGHMRIRTGPWSNATRWPGLMNIMWTASCIAYLGKN